MLPMAAPAHMLPPAPALPRTESSPALPTASGPVSPAQPRAGSSSGSLRPGGPLTPPHRTHAVAREQLASAFASAPHGLPPGPSLSRTASPGAPELSPKAAAAAAAGLERSASGSQWPHRAHMPTSSAGSQAETGFVPVPERSLGMQQDAGSGSMARQRSLADKELRRRAAADTAQARMSNLERQTMSGLDLFSQQSKPTRPGQLARSSITG